MMFRRKNHVGGSKKRIGTSGKYPDISFIVIQILIGDISYLKINVSSDRFSDPIALHLFRGMRPVKILKPFKQAVGIFRNLKDPLSHGLPDNRIPSHLTFAI